MLDATLLALLKKSIAFEDSDSYGTPSGNYYWFRKRREIEALLHRNQYRLPVHDGSLIVDLGCGSGSDLFLLRRLLAPAIPDSAYIGIEAEPSSLQLCEIRRKHHGEPSDVEFLAGDLTAGLPFEAETVTLLYSSEVLEHLPEPDRLLREAARVVVPGGCFLLTTPNQPNPLQRSFWSLRRRRAMRHAALRRQVEVEADAIERGAVPIHGHISLRTTRQWDRTLDAHGFALVDVGRGALHYGSTPFVDREPILAGMFALQATLDLFPRRVTRRFSDQVIALYRRLA